MYLGPHEQNIVTPTKNHSPIRATESIKARNSGNDKSGLLQTLCFLFKSRNEGPRYFSIFPVLLWKYRSHHLDKIDDFTPL